MASTSPAEDARALLACCLAGTPWPAELLDRLMAPEAASALFGGVIEPLCDAFSPRLCDVYVELFAEIAARALPGLDIARLVEHRRCVRRPRVCRMAQATDVLVLSRVTLGADVAVTSLVLDAARRRFPDARVWLAGPRKTWELFGGRGDVGLIEVPYGRGATLEERLAGWPMLRAAVDTRPGAVVIDPDSRLTQLGLLPVCADEERYFFFESRSAGGESDASLQELTRAWLAATFGIGDARAWIEPVRAPIAGDPRRRISVSLGVGGNAAKRLSDAFERELLETLARTGREAIVDKGGDTEEAARVDRAIAGLDNVRTWQGDFATFAATIAASGLYVGYDSAGQHVAAACGVPLISIFAGAPSDRFFARWRPAGAAGSAVIRADGRTDAEVLDAVRGALALDPTRAV